MDINAITNGLVKKDGIWYAEKKAFVSYQEDGNETCLQIEENSFWFRHRNKCIVSLIKQFRPKGTFFDIGGGNGFVAKAIEDAGIETVLIEPGEQGCVNARNRKIQNVICSTIEDAGFRKNSMPAAGVFDVVEHFKDDKALLRTIREYLQPEGLLFITVPAHNILWSHDDTAAGHFNRYTLASMRQRLEEAGYQVQFETYMFSILPLPIFLFRTLPTKLGKYKNADTLQKVTSEHKKENPIAEKVWAWELGRIQQGKKVPFGGSCLVVAKKVGG